MAEVKSLALVLVWLWGGHCALWGWLTDPNMTTKQPLVCNQSVPANILKWCTCSDVAHDLLNLPLDCQTFRVLKVDHSPHVATSIATFADQVFVAISVSGILNARHLLGQRKPFHSCAQVSLDLLGLHKE